MTHPDAGGAGQSGAMPFRGLGFAVAVALILAPPRASAQTWHTVVRSRQTQGEERLRVHTRFGAGRFTLGPAVGGSLYVAELRYDADRFRPVLEYRTSSASLEVGVEGRDRRANIDWDSGDPQRLDLKLSPNVPLWLTLEFGAAQADLELGSLRLERGTIKTGASESTIAFSQLNPVACSRLEILAGAAELTVTGLANARCERIEVTGGFGSITLDFTGDLTEPRETRVDVKLGVGDLVLRIPETVGVQIDVDRLLASVDLSGFERRGEHRVSPGFDQAASRLHVHIGAALGDIKVEWVKP
jgi:hypothetical protein